MALRTVTPTIRRHTFGATPHAAERIFAGSAVREQELYVNVEKALGGKLNNTAEVTLSVAPATSTVFTDPRITPSSVVLWVATTANAAAQPITYVTAGVGTVTLNHASHAATDRTFRIAVFA